MDIAVLQKALAAGDWPTAERVLRPVAQASGAHPSMVYNYGKVLLELGRAAEAAACFTRVVQAAPDHANAWFELGRAALKDDDLARAEQAFSQALTLSPKDKDAMRNLGRVAMRRGHFEVAKDAWHALEGDEEADLALYRCAAELNLPEAAARRADLLARHPNRAAVIRTLVRVSKGAVPLNL